MHTEGETGETVNVEPKKLPYFKVGKELKEMVWKEEAEK
jgi:nucleoid DNA-binding protein